MARPRLKLDLVMMEKLAGIGCKNTEIAAMLGCDSSTLSDAHYSEIIAKGKEQGRMSLRRKMWETAMGGNITMMIWLSKQLLGYSDKIENDTKITTDALVTRVVLQLPDNGSEAPKE